MRSDATDKQIFHPAVAGSFYFLQIDAGGNVFTE